MFLTNPTLRREFLSLIPGNNLKAMLVSPALRQPRRRYVARRHRKPSSPVAPAQPGQWHHWRAVLRRRHLPAGHRRRPPAVSALYGHIQRDARHKATELLASRKFASAASAVAPGQVNLAKLNHPSCSYPSAPSLTPAASGKVRRLRCSRSSWLRPRHRPGPEKRERTAAARLFR